MSNTNISKLTLTNSETVSSSLIVLSFLAKYGSLKNLSCIFILMADFLVYLTICLKVPLVSSSLVSWNSIPRSSRIWSLSVATPLLFSNPFVSIPPKASPTVKYPPPPLPPALLQRSRTAAYLKPPPPPTPTRSLLGADVGVLLQQPRQRPIRTCRAPSPVPRRPLHV